MTAVLKSKKLETSHEIGAVYLLENYYDELDHYLLATYMGFVSLSDPGLMWSDKNALQKYITSGKLTRLPAGTVIEITSQV